jgi:hypothetical protein
MYKVEKILDKKVNGDNVEYKIKWKGYSINESTWEPLKNLKNIEEMVSEFDKNFEKNVSKKNDKKLKKSEERGATTGISLSLEENESGLEKNKSEVKKKRGRPRKTEKSFLDKLKPSKNEIVSSISSEIETNVANKESDLCESENEKEPIMNEIASPGSAKSVIVAYEIPKKIINAKINNKDEIFFYVEWQKRSDGTKPADSYVTNDSMRTYFPNLLLDYYQSKVINSNQLN